MRSPPWVMPRRARRWGWADRSDTGDSVGRPGTSPLRIVTDGGGSPIFPPLDHALVKALACELVAETKQPRVDRPWAIWALDLCRDRSPHDTGPLIQQAPIGL